MRHSVFGRKLSRTKNERRRLFQILARDLFVQGSIETTQAKAKAVQPLVETLITKAKDHTNGSLKQLRKIIASREVEKMLLADATTRFANRTSGFTRIVKLGKRVGDASNMVIFSLVDPRVETDVVAPKKVAAAEVKEEVKEVKTAKKAKAKK